jgi:outer membrane protein
LTHRKSDRYNPRFAVFALFKQEGERMKRYRHTRSIWMALVALLIFPAAGTWAQGGAAGAVPTKIAVLNVRQAIVSTAEGKVASAQLQTQFAPQQTDLQNMQKQMQDLQSRLSNGSRTLSDEEQARLQRQGEMMSRQFQRKQDDLNESVNAAQSDVVDTIGRKMLDVLDRFARENGYAAVLDTSAQGTPVVYGSSQVDITQDIIRLYDQQYPVKGSSAAPAGSAPPAAPKPVSSGAASTAPKKAQ